MMRLIQLRIRNFRGFGNTVDPIRLDGDLVLIYGPNGFGKTSIAEAIEWLFYGMTKRRRRGETYSRVEYANTYANVHGGVPVEVEAVVDLGGREIRLGRRITTGEETQTFVDGRAAPFSSLGLAPAEAAYPVVAQHGLQTFIHTKPKDRRDAISAALGLDELTTLKSVLDSARSTFQRSPPSAVVEARRLITADIQTIARIPETQKLAQRWQKSPPDVDVRNDLADLLRAAVRLSGKKADSVASVLPHLREARQTASRAVFDVSSVAPADNFQEAVQRVGASSGTLEARMQETQNAIGSTLAALAAAHSTALLQFWKVGLDLAPEGETCPMCEEPTLSRERREELKRRLEAGATRIAGNEALKEAAATTKQATAALQAATVACGANRLGPDGRTALSRLMDDKKEAITSFLAAYDGLAAARAQVEQSTGRLKGFLDECPQRLADPEKAPEVVGQTDSAKREVLDAAKSYGDAAARFSVAWTAFEPQLAARISTSEAVAQIDAIGKALRGEAAIRSLARYQAVLRESQELIRTVESELQAKQKELLDTRGQDVKTLYDLLNPGAEVGFDCMEPGTDTLKLHAKSFGRRMPAAANLSECQLNCLGLAVWLMRATTPSTPFGFVLLDDPVQSMDDDHAESFMAKLIPDLLDTYQKQVIVLTHVRHVSDRLRGLNIARRLRLYHLDSYSRSGPVVTEQNLIAKLISEIEGAAKGNESNREHAVDRMRVLVERIVRELYLRVARTPLPETYDAAQPAKLLTAFRQIPDTTPAEHAGMKDTVGFCDPAHHSEVGYSVPQTSNIIPHIDRLKTLIRKYQLG